MPARTIAVDAEMDGAALASCSCPPPPACTTAGVRSAATASSGRLASSRRTPRLLPGRSVVVGAGVARDRVAPRELAQVRAVALHDARGQRQVAAGVREQLTEIPALPA